MAAGAHVKIDGVWVGVMFPTSEKKWSTGWFVDEPSGDLRASVQVTCDPNYQAPWTLPGKRYELWAPNGGRLFGGITAEPDRGPGGLTIHGRGIGSVLAEWPAVTFDATRDVTVPTFVPNDAVDYAAANGAPFSRYGVDLGTTSLSTAEDGAVTDIGTLLTRAAVAQGKRCHVDSQGAITFQADPSTPKWTLTPDENYMGTADPQFVTKLWGHYVVAGESQFQVAAPGATGGTFTLSGNGATTAALAENASAATVQTAVRGLGGVFSDALVQGPAGGTWLVTVYTGGVLFSGDGSSLTPAAASLSVSPNMASRMTSVSDAAAEAKFGNRQRTIDLSKLGVMTATQAGTYLAGRFAIVGGRMGWTEGVDLSGRNLMHISGAWAEARAPRAGDMLQIPGVVDSRSNPTTRGAIRFVTSEIEVTEADDPSAFAAPVGFSPRDFEGALAPPENPTDKEAA